MPGKKRKTSSDFFVIAHNIRSLYNVGSFFRTADSLGIDKLYLTGYTATPDSNHKLAKTALGAEKSVAWGYDKSAIRLIKKLRQEYPKIQMVGLENNLPKQFQSKTIKLAKFKIKFPLVLILGEEVKGIPKTLWSHIDQFIEIPMQGQKESLNVAVAYGIAAYVINNKKSR